MCTTHDAKRYEKLGTIQEESNNTATARKNYLEAASIYVLKAQSEDSRSLLKDANRCYRLASAVIEKKVEEFSLQQLAIRCLHELHNEELVRKNEEKKSTNVNEQKNNQITLEQIELELENV
jgi:hypothetical protein